MKRTPISWHRPCTATATADEEPPVIMMAPSRSIMRRAESRAASALVCVSPVTDATFLPRMPLPFSVLDEKVGIMPPSPPPLRCSMASS